MGKNGQDPRRSLGSDASWVLLGNVVFTLSQFLLLAILAKIGTVEQVGQFALANAIAAPVFMLSDLNLRAYLATDARDEFPFATYLACRAVCSAIALVAVALTALATGQRGEPLVVLACVGLAKAFESMGTIVFGLYQKRDRVRWLAASLTLRSLLGLMFFGSVLALTEGLAWAVGALALSRLAVFAFFDVPLGRRLEPLWASVDMARVMRLARAALPLGLVMMLISLNANLALYFIESFLGTEEVGLFAALLYLISAGRLVINALSQTAGPRLARYLQAGDIEGFDRLQQKLMIAGLLTGLGGAAVAWLVGDHVLELAYSREYAAQTSLLVWLLVANSFAFANTFLGTGLTASRSFGQMLGINVFSLAVSGVCLAAMVPRSGLMGATVAIGASAAAKLALNLYINRLRAASRNGALP